MSFVEQQAQLAGHRRVQRRAESRSRTARDARGSGRRRAAIAASNSSSVRGDAGDDGRSLRRCPGPAGRWARSRRTTRARGASSRCAMSCSSTRHVRVGPLLVRDSVATVQSCVRGKLDGRSGVAQGVGDDCDTRRPQSATTTRVAVGARSRRGSRRCRPRRGRRAPSSDSTSATTAGSPPTSTAWSTTTAGRRTSRRTSSCRRCAGCARPTARSPSSRGSTRSRRTPASTSSAARGAREEVSYDADDGLGAADSAADLASRRPTSPSSRSSRSTTCCGAFGGLQRDPPRDPRDARARGAQLPRDRRAAGHDAPGRRVDALPRAPPACRGVRGACHRRALHARPGDRRQRRRRRRSARATAAAGRARLALPDLPPSCRSPVGSPSPSLERSVRGRVAAVLPFPALLRRREDGSIGGRRPRAGARTAGRTGRRRSTPRSSAGPALRSLR